MSASAASWSLTTNTIKAWGRPEIKSQIEEHFREVSAQLPFYKRVKVLEFTDQELPRTGTRKVKRREVIALLQNILANQKAAPLELIRADGSPMA